MTNVPYQDVSKPNYADPMNAQPAPMNSQQPTVMFSQPVLQPFYQPPMAQPGIVYQQQQPILVPNGVPNGMNITSPPPKVKCTPWSCMLYCRNYYFGSFSCCWYSFKYYSISTTLSQKILNYRTLLFLIKLPLMQI